MRGVEADVVAPQQHAVAVERRILDRLGGDRRGELVEAADRLALRLAVGAGRSSTRCRQRSASIVARGLGAGGLEGAIRDARPRQDSRAAARIGAIDAQMTDHATMTARRIAPRVRSRSRRGSARSGRADRRRRPTGRGNCAPAVRCARSAPPRRNRSVRRLISCQ